MSLTVECVAATAPQGLWDCDCSECSRMQLDVVYAQEEPNSTVEELRGWYR